MHAYLTQAGLNLLQSHLGDLSSFSMTGSQVGDTAGFTPNEAMTQAQGTLLVDNHAFPTTVKLTRLNTHEMIFTVILDRNVEYASIGNVLFFANGLSFLWLVAEQTFGKQKINPITHYAGDKVYLSVVFRFPYIEKMLPINADNALHAKFPIVKATSALSIPEHTLADQVAVDTNDMAYGRDTPFFVARSGSGWFGFPVLRPLGESFFKFDGGKTGAGQ